MRVLLKAALALLLVTVGGCSVNTYDASNSWRKVCVGDGVCRAEHLDEDGEVIGSYSPCNWPNCTTKRINEKGETIVWTRPCREIPAITLRDVLGESADLFLDAEECARRLCGDR